MRFVGDYPAKADAKGRVFLPAQLRKVIEAEGEQQKFVLRNDVHQPCLVLYPQSVWDATVDDLKSRLNMWDANHKSILRKFVMSAEPVELDSNGRLLISKRKLEFAGIQSEVRFVAVDDTIEVWGRETLDKQMEGTPDLGESISALIGG